MVIIYLLEALPDCFSKEQHHFTYPPTVWEGTGESASPLTLVTILSVLLGTKWSLVVLTCIS